MLVVATVGLLKEDELGGILSRYHTVQGIACSNQFCNYIGDIVHSFGNAIVSGSPLQLFSPLEDEDILRDVFRTFLGNISMKDAYKNDPMKITGALKRIALSLCESLGLLHDAGICHGMLCIDDVFLKLDPVTEDNMGCRMANYALPYIFNAGLCRRGMLKYSSPETLLMSQDELKEFRPKSDVWALGIILAELLDVFVPPKEDCFKTNSTPMSFFSQLIGDSAFDPDLVDFVTRCLYVAPDDRDSIASLLEHSFIERTLPRDSTWECGNQTYTVLNTEQNKLFRHLCQGNDCGPIPQVTGNLVVCKLVDVEFPPIVPAVGSTQVSCENSTEANAPSAASMITAMLLTPFEKQGKKCEQLAIESNVPYLISRIQECSRLISIHSLEFQNAFHELKETHQELGRILEIPDFLRKFLWTSLLGVALKPCERSSPTDCFSGGYVMLHEARMLQYKLISNMQYHDIERQLEQDIPRCHQYHVIMRSETAKRQLTENLITWAIYHPQCDYWQGLDSICASTVAMYLGNLSVSFAVFEEITSQHLPGMFSKQENKNSKLLYLRLSTMMQLVQFHDPVVALHLRKLEIKPDLFAIPWLLTMFAHVFPMHILWPLWDEMFLETKSTRGTFVLLFAVSIIVQLRQVILHLDNFGECIAFLTRFPISLDQLVPCALQLTCEAIRITPRFQNVAWMQIDHSVVGFCPQLNASQYLRDAKRVLPIWINRDTIEAVVLKGSIRCSINDESSDRIVARIKQEFVKGDFWCIMVCVVSEEDEMALELCRVLVEEFELAFVCVSEPQIVEKVRELDFSNVTLFSS